MADAFYDVDEQLRAARLQSLFRRSWPYAAGVLALILAATLGVWAWRAYEASAEGDNSQRYADALQALTAGDAAKAQAQFSAMAKDGTPAYRALALMQEAGIKLKAEDEAGAAGLFDQAAAAAGDPITPRRGQAARRLPAHGHRALRPDARPAGAAVQDRPALRHPG